MSRSVVAVILCLVVISSGCRVTSNVSDTSMERIEAAIRETCGPTPAAQAEEVQG